MTTITTKTKLTKNNTDHSHNPNNNKNANNSNDSIYFLSHFLFEVIVVICAATKAKALLEEGLQSKPYILVRLISVFCMLHEPFQKNNYCTTKVVAKLIDPMFLKEIQNNLIRKKISQQYCQKRPMTSVKLHQRKQRNDLHGFYLSNKNC